MSVKISLFEIGCHYIHPRLCWNSWSSCLCLLNARTTGVHCYTQLETSPLTHRPLGIQTKVAIPEGTNTLEFHWILKTKTSQKQQTIEKAKQSTGTHTSRASCCVASTLPSGLLSHPQSPFLTGPNTRVKGVHKLWDIMQNVHYHTHCDFTMVTSKHVLATQRAFSLM